MTDIGDSNNSSSKRSRANNKKPAVRVPSPPPAHHEEDDEEELDHDEDEYHEDAESVTTVESNPESSSAPVERDVRRKSRSVSGSPPDLGQPRSSNTKKAPGLMAALTPSLASRRQSHITSEQKRRQNINEGFDDLRRLLPTCHGNSDSKALVLRKAVSYIGQLQAEMARMKGYYGQQHPSVLAHHPSMMQSMPHLPNQSYAPPIPQSNSPYAPYQSSYPYHTQLPPPSHIPSGSHNHSHSHSIYSAKPYHSAVSLEQTQAPTLPPLHVGSTSNLVHLVNYGGSGGSAAGSPHPPEDDNVAASLSMLRGQVEYGSHASLPRLVNQ